MAFRRAAKFNSGLWIENWSYVEASHLRLVECVGVTEELRRRANIDLSQPIWNDSKVSKLVANTKKRKILYSLVFAGFWLSVLIACILLVLMTACIFDGQKCPDIIQYRILSSFCIASVIAAGLLIWIRKIGRNPRLLDFEDYLSADLSEENRDTLKQEIRALKNAEEELYEIGTYEKFRKIDPVSWRAENWFLLLTENEKDRSGIWLDQHHPIGTLYMRVKRNIKRGEIDDVVWGKVYLEYTRFVFSERSRLSSFIDYQSNQTLNQKQKVWLEAFEFLFRNREAHISHLNRTLTHEGRAAFFDQLTRILAKNSNRYSKEVASKGLEGIDYHDLGGSGATRLVHGQNENIEKWIKKYLGIT